MAFRHVSGQEPRWTFNFELPLLTLMSRFSTVLLLIIFTEIMPKESVTSLKQQNQDLKGKVDALSKGNNAAEREGSGQFGHYLCVNDSSFSLLCNNIRSLKRNLENFQVHLLDELNFEFSIIGVSETKTISGKEMDFNPSIPGYVFEYVPTPLASGGVGLYINDSLK